MGNVWRVLPKISTTGPKHLAHVGGSESSTYHLVLFWKVKSKFDQNLSKYFRFSIKIRGQGVQGLVTMFCEFAGGRMDYH